MTQNDHPLKQALQWLEAGRGVAVATVVETWGSSPRPIGSQMVVDDQGAFMGSVSGGCIEGEIITRALEVISGSEQQVADFGVSNEMAWEVGLSCGGQLKVLIRHETDADLLKRLMSDDGGVLVTHLESGAQSVVDKNGVAGELVLPDTILELAQGSLVRGGSRAVEEGGEKYFLQICRSQQRMLIIGAVHVSQHLAPMAAMAGFDVTVIDPRGVFATDERFPGVTLDQRWPDEAIEELGVDGSTAMVALTHDPKFDDPALELALKSDCFYIGALGSRRTHAKRLERLSELGFGEQDFQRIHAPIGLNIGAKTSVEIAISVLSEVIATLRLVPEEK